MDFFHTICPMCSDYCGPVNYYHIGIAFFGIAAIWVVGRPGSWRRWGYVLGLMSQPFWFIMAVSDKNCALFVLSLFYAASWARGVWYHFFAFDAPKEKFLERVKIRATLLNMPEHKLWEEIVDEYFKNHPNTIVEPEPGAEGLA